MLKENINPHYSQEWCEDVVDDARIDFRRLMKDIVTTLKKNEDVSLSHEDVEHIGDAISDAMLNEKGRIAHAVKVLASDYDIEASITNDFFGLSYKQLINRLMEGSL